MNEDKVKDKNRDMKSQTKASVGFGAQASESDSRIRE